MRQSVFVATAQDRAALQERMFAFYASAEGYFDEVEAGEGNRFHAAVKGPLQDLATARGGLDVLEVGAGRSVLPLTLRGLGLPGRVYVALQDVTPSNADYLAGVADEVLIGPLDTLAIDGRFDVVLSTFVYEHVVDPAAFLDNCMRALRPGGLLIIFSPKYSMPGYVPPALRHLSFLRRHLITLRSAASAWVSCLTRRPAFLVLRQPAVFAATWFRDADAVHLVHPIDARLHLAGRATGQRLRVQVLSATDRRWQAVALYAQLFRKL